MRFPFPAIADFFRERGGVDQPHPDVTDADVERIVRRDFPRVQFEPVMAVLAQYGSKSELGRARVRLAALKLADGHLDKLQKAIDVAKRDYRDVLVPAEYPKYSIAGFQTRKLPLKKRKGIVESDWKQYQSWLRR